MLFKSDTKKGVSKAVMAEALPFCWADKVDFHQISVFVAVVSCYGRTAPEGADSPRAFMAVMRNQPFDLLPALY